MICLVAEHGRLVKGTATGLRSPKALVNIKDLMWPAACSLCSVVPGTVLSFGVLEENPPQAFLPPFLLQRPLCDLRGKPSFFPLTLNLPLFYPSASLVNRLSALSLDDSCFSFHPGMPRGQAGWLSWWFFCCGPLSFGLPGPPPPHALGGSRASYRLHSVPVPLELRPPYLLARPPCSCLAHPCTPVGRPLSLVI